MTIIRDYFNLTLKYQMEYGMNTLLLMQVGSFFECYALFNPDSNYYTGSQIKQFSDINDLVISKKQSYLRYLLFYCDNNNVIPTL